MSAVPSSRQGAGAAEPSKLRKPGAGLTVVPRIRRGRAREVRRSSKFAVMFRSNPVRVTVSLLVVSGVVFGLVLLNIYVAQTSFHLSDLQRRAAELQTEQRRLRYEVARAESPEKIVEMGAALGLVAPSSQEYLDGPSLLVAEETVAGDYRQEEEQASR
jgi:cell division protein FtsL